MKTVSMQRILISERSTGVYCPLPMAGTSGNIHNYCKGQIDGNFFKKEPQNENRLKLK